MTQTKVAVQLKDGTKLGEVSQSATIGAAKLASKVLGRAVQCGFERRNGEYVWEVKCAFGSKELNPRCQSRI